MVTDTSPGGISVRPVSGFGVSQNPEKYHARIWGPPVAAGHARTVDEWELTGATDAKDAILWALDRAGAGTVEVFAVVSVPSGDSRRSSRRNYVRVFGNDGDPDGSVELVTLTADDAPTEIT